MRESGDWKRGCICSARRRECGIFTGCTCLVSEILADQKINTETCAFTSPRQTIEYYKIGKNCIPLTFQTFAWIL